MRKLPVPDPRGLTLEVSLWPSLLSLYAVPACVGLRQRWQHRPRNTTVGTGLAQSLTWLGIRPRQAG